LNPLRQNHVDNYALALYSVINTDVVTADGRLLTTDLQKIRTSFLGVCGGKGNFGIFTSLEYRFHEIGSVLGCAVFYAAAKAQEVLYFWREFAAVTATNWSPRAVLFIFRMTSPCFESLFPIHREALELTTSNDATSRGTKRVLS